MSRPSKTEAPKGENKTLNTKGLDRRRFFMMGGSAVAAAAIVPMTGTEAEADSESQAERVKARYRVTDEVKTFYRVNRY
jgi:hypothetical protein